METVLCHGLGEDSRQWEGVRQRLPFSTCCPDLFRLTGERPLNYRALYAGFEAYCDRLEGQVRLCGLSLGGVLALEYAARRREKVESLVLVGTPYELPWAALAVQGTVFRLTPRRVFAGMGLEKGDAIALMSSMKKLELPALAAQVRCRTLVLCGEQDRTNLPAVEGLCNAIEGSVGRRLPGAGHQAEVDAPEALAEELKQFWR